MPFPDNERNFWGTDPRGPGTGSPRPRKSIQAKPLTEWTSVTSQLPERIMKVDCKLSWRLPGHTGFTHPGPFIFCPVNKTFRRWKNNRDVTKYVTDWKPA